MDYSGARFLLNLTFQSLCDGNVALQMADKFTVVELSFSGLSSTCEERREMARREGMGASRAVCCLLSFFRRPSLSLVDNRYRHNENPSYAFFFITVHHLSDLHREPILPMR